MRARVGVTLSARARSYTGASGSIAPASIKQEKTSRSISDFERVANAGDRYPVINAVVNFAALPGFPKAALISIAMLRTAMS